MSRGKLTFTIGPARCGKSTYCNGWRDYRLEEECLTPLNERRPRVIVCADDIRLALHNERYNRHAEIMVWAVHYYEASSLLIRGHDVIIDGTNTTKESLFRVLSIDVNAEYVLFNTSVEECERRALECGHDDLVSKGVIRRQWGQLEEMREQGVKEVIQSIRDKILERYP